jgi:pilus assembly protein CpaB
MFKRRGMFLVLLSLAMGVLAAWAANNWVQSRLGATGDVASDMERVVVAATDIPYGTKVEARHVRMIELPPDSVPANAFRDAVEAQETIATMNVMRGEILIRDRFSAHESGSTLAALVQEGMRAVTVRVDDVVGVAGFLLPGNRVDVLSTRMEANRRAITETILRNLRVLAVDQTAATERNDPVIVRAVTLEMTPAQSEELVRAKEEGRIQLTLRNPLNQELEEVEEIVVQEPPPPAPRPVVRPAPRPAQNDSQITIIRGMRVNTERPPS